MRMGCGSDLLQFYSEKRRMGEWRRVRKVRGKEAERDTMFTAASTGLKGPAQVSN
jgi:hypothetical protein